MKIPNTQTQHKNHSPGKAWGRVESPHLNAVGTLTSLRRGYGSEQTLYTRTGGVGIAGKYRALEQKIPPKSKEGFDPQGLKRRFDNTNMAKPWGEIRRGERKKSPNMGTSRDTRRALEQKIPKIQRIKRQTDNTKHIQTHVNYENLQRIKDIGGESGRGS